MARPRARWRTIEELSALLLERARRGRTVQLTPRTAFLVAEKLTTADSRPSVKEVAAIVCQVRPACERACYACQGKTNEIIRLYGAKTPDRTLPPLLDPSSPRLGDLREWELINLRCLDCSHQKLFRPADLAAKAGAESTVHDIEGVAACPVCKGSRIMLSIEKVKR